MTVYIEKVEGEFRTINEYTAWRGFQERGAHIEFFRLDEFAALSVAPGTPVVAGIPTVHHALERLGVSVPQLAAVPEELHNFAGRRTGETTLREARERVLDGEGPLFIKPLQTSKLFNGHVIGAFRDFIITAGVPDNTPVFFSEIAPFVAEYRGFVHRGELVGFRHYKGDFMCTPDFAIVRAGLDAWAEKPVGCSMDWGVTQDGRTLLVEVNDGYSLGCYGLMPLFYASLLADRWLEMTGT